MNENQMKSKSILIIQQVVDIIANRQYDRLATIVDLELLNVDLIIELVEGYLELNELPFIDPYGVECNFHPKYEYHQLSFYFYDNGSGFSIDYDLTTNNELNDLTLQMEFLIDGDRLKAKLKDLHVL